VHWADPLAIKNGINDPIIQQFHWLVQPLA